MPRKIKPFIGKPGETVEQFRDRCLPTLVNLDKSSDPNQNEDYRWMASSAKAIRKRLAELGVPAPDRGKVVLKYWRVVSVHGKFIAHFDRVDDPGIQQIAEEHKVEMWVNVHDPLGFVLRVFPSREEPTNA